MRKFAIKINIVVRSRPRKWTPILISKTRFEWVFKPVHTFIHIALEFRSKSSTSSFKFNTYCILIINLLNLITSFFLQNSPIILYTYLRFKGIFQEIFLETNSLFSPLIPYNKNVTDNYNPITCYYLDLDYYSLYFYKEKVFRLITFVALWKFQICFI